MKSGGRAGERDTDIGGDDMSLQKRLKLVVVFDFSITFCYILKTVGDGGQ